METFQNQSIIRLRSSQNKYLVAEKDEESIAKSRDGSTRNAHWTVEVVDDESIRLKSCYGKYLTASNVPSIPGRTARHLKVTQTLPAKFNTSHLWMPVTEGHGSAVRRAHSHGHHHQVGTRAHVRLKTRHGSYLKTHKGPPPMGHMVTHDLPRKNGPQHDWRTAWMVETVDTPSDLWRESHTMVAKFVVSMKAFMSEVQKGKGRIKETIMVPMRPKATHK